MEFVLVHAFTCACHQYIPQIMFSLKSSAQVMILTFSENPEHLPEKPQAKALSRGEEDS